MARSRRCAVALSRTLPLGLFPAAAFAVHQLRYWLAFGSRAGLMLSAQGHSYLHSVVPWIILLVALTVGFFVRALGRAFHGQASLSGYTVSFSALWVLCAAALVGIYMTQEFLEGLLATGHPGGLVGIFGYGGWWAIPVALAVGLVLAAIFHGARWVLREVAERRGGSLRLAHGRATLPCGPRGISALRLAPLAAGWSDRGPPLRS